MEFEYSKDEHSLWKRWLTDHDLVSKRQMEKAIFLSKKIQPGGWLPQLYMENDFVEKQDSILCISWFGKEHVMLNIEIDTHGGYIWDYYDPSTTLSLNGSNDFIGEHLMEFHKNLIPATRHGKIELWSEKNQLDCLIDRHMATYPDESYTFFDGRTVGQIREQLRALDLTLPSAAKDVAAVLTIGTQAKHLNTSWVSPEACMVCDSRTYEMVAFTNSAGDDKSYVCGPCIKKAQEQLDSNTN